MHIITEVVIIINMKQNTNYVDKTILITNK